MYLAFFSTFFTLPVSELSLVGLAFDVIDWPLSFSAMTLFIGSNVHSSSSRMHVMNHNSSATKQRLHPQSVAEISRHSVLSGDRIQQCETSSGSRHEDADQCLLVAISFCRHQSVPVPCENGSAETTVAEGGWNSVAGLWGHTLGENWPPEPTSTTIDFWCQMSFKDLWCIEWDDKPYSANTILLTCYIHWCCCLFCLSLPDGVGRSQSDQSVRSSGILRPPSSITATAVASVSNVQCPFCLVNFYPGRRPLEEQLVDHIISSCGLKDRQ